MTLTAGDFLLMLLWVMFIAFSALVVNTRRNWHDIGLYIALAVLFVLRLVTLPFRVRIVRSNSEKGS